MTRLYAPVFALLLALMLSGCSVFQGEEKVPPESELWAQATEALDDNNHLLAIEKLEQLESRYPFGRHSTQAQLELIYAYYKTDKKAETRAAADRFIRLHPNHENSDYAYYLRGLSNFNEDANVITRYTPTDQSKRDPGAARDSFSDFATLLQRYPNSQYAPDARKRMLHLRNQLAAYEIHVARFYVRRKAFLAAANRGRQVVENFPRTPMVPAALQLMAHSYRQLELPELAARSERVLAENFPDFDPDENAPPAASDDPEESHDVSRPPATPR